MTEDVRMFVNGQGMRGGSLHYALAETKFLGETRTAPRYRFFSFGDFPGLQPAAAGGTSITGELYAVPYERLREELLPNEPAELELSIIKLADGRGSLSMIVRPGVEASGVEITEHGSWQAYLASRSR